MIFCIGGVSGSGKSTLIYNHPELEALLHIDVSDAYRRAEERGVTIPWEAAFDELLNEARHHLDNHQKDIVLEAFFRPGSEQRIRVLDIASQYNQQIIFVWCHAPRPECIRRVDRQQGDSQLRKAARLRFINETNERWFQPIRDEEADEILDSTGECMQCMARTGLVGPDYEYCEECVPSDHVYDSNDDSDESD